MFRDGGGSLCLEIVCLEMAGSLCLEMAAAVCV